MTLGVFQNLRRFGVCVSNRKAQSTHSIFLKYRPKLASFSCFRHLHIPISTKQIEKA